MLTLDKAIEILQAIRHTGHYQPTLDDVDAIELGAEGLKKIQNIRILFPTLMPDLLPGEYPMPDFSPSADRKQLIRKSNLGRESGQ